jgi:galactonate dehydratase
LHGRREFKPFLDHYATDVAIVDVIWNGLVESAKIAAMADVHEINVAPHNFYGHLCSAISATFSAIVPNFRVMEIDIDSAPWRDEFYTTVPTIEDGEFILPSGPGWGIDVNEKAVRARPPRN